MANINFTGKGQPGNLLDPKNWMGGVVPAGIDGTAVITTDVGGPVNGTFTVNNLMLLGPEHITFTGTLNTLGAVGCQGLMVCVGAVATFAPGAVFNDHQDLIVGLGGTGTIVGAGTGSNHSVINSFNTKLGAQVRGNGTITIDDGVWNNSAGIVVGDWGKGTINVIDGGSVVVGGSVELGLAAGSSGTVNIASGGSVTVDGILWVGATGAATPDSIGVISVGVGSSLTTGNMLYVNKGSEIDMTGGTVSGGATTNCVTVLNGGLISGFGTLATPDGTAIQDAGIIRATGGTLAITQNIKGVGAIQIGANSTAALTGSSLGLAGIAFIGPNATLSLAHGAVVTSAISGFALTDMISMANITAVSFTASTGVLKLMNNATAVGSLHMVGNFTGDTFAVHQSAGTGIITLQHS
jgi:T5SS/PEP-CTERM-associated repeat protein